MNLTAMSDMDLSHAHAEATRSYEEIKGTFNRMAVLREEAWMRMELIMLEIERRREADRMAHRVNQQAGERA